MTGRDLRTSHEFRGFTAAGPARVWTVLTGPQTACFLYGLSPRSTWVVGDPIAFHGDAGAAHGVVLYVEEPVRLTYSLRSGPDDPVVFLTWRLRPCSGGCAISLTVDDLECPEDQAGAEEIWLPVLANLQRLLDGFRSGRTAT